MPAVVIGVTGHRKLQNQPGLAKQVRATLERLGPLIFSVSNAPVMFSALSPLAEGADRLVVHEVLNHIDSQLDVVLPLDKADYLQDFKTADCKAEFEQLFSEARSITQLPPTGTRNESYAQAGPLCSRSLRSADCALGRQAGGRGGRHSRHCGVCQ